MRFVGLSGLVCPRMSGDRPVDMSKVVQVRARRGNVSLCNCTEGTWEAVRGKKKGPRRGLVSGEGGGCYSVCTASTIDSGDSWTYLDVWVRLLWPSSF